MMAVLVSELYASTAGIGFIIALAGTKLDVLGFHVAMAAAALMMYLSWLVLSIAEARTAYRDTQKRHALEVGTG
jgi:ABC-type nitrate/sulfonate/bicarbonate transport system permease component